MSSTPRLSVVMPVYNARKYVAQSVRSILAQSFGDFEFVIGDDGSDDGGSALLAELAAGDPRIRLLRRDKPSGLAASANWVVGEARAPIVAIAHADDKYEPDRLARQLAVLEQTPDAAMVGTMARGIDARGRVVQPPNLKRIAQPSSFAAFVHSSIMFRRQAFERVGGYRAEAEFWEDLDLYWRLAEQGKLLILPDVLVNYRHSEASVRERRSREWESALVRMFDSVNLHSNGNGRDGALRPKRESTRIGSRVFVARAIPFVWSGKPAPIMQGMIERMSWRPFLPALANLAFVAWAAIGPRSLRALMGGWIRLGNRSARASLQGVNSVEWDPRTQGAANYLGSTHPAP